jgi:hypothetical protein
MRVIKGEYIKDYKIKLTFNNNVEKIVDFSSFLKDAKNLSKALLDLDYFKSFRIDETTISWPNEYDFCPDVLYKVGKEIKPPRQSMNLRLQPAYLKKKKPKSKP